MASRTIATAALFIALNLVFFTMVSADGTCPTDALKLNVCADLLGGAVHVALPQNSTCCSLLNGLADLDAAVCLCTAIKANVLGVDLTLPIDLTLILNPCGKKLPQGFEC